MLQRVQLGGNGSTKVAWRGHEEPSAARVPEADALLVSCGAPIPSQRKEFELVKQALYTDPDDQSAWIYHRWLIGQSKWSRAGAFRSACAVEPTLTTCFLGPRYICRRRRHRRARGQHHQGAVGA